DEHGAEPAGRSRAGLSSPAESALVAVHAAPHLSARAVEDHALGGCGLAVARLALRLLAGCVDLGGRSLVVEPTDATDKPLLAEGLHHQSSLFLSRDVVFTTLGLGALDVGAERLAELIRGHVDEIDTLVIALDSALVISGRDRHVVRLDGHGDVAAPGGAGRACQLGELTTQVF